MTPQAMGEVIEALEAGRFRQAQSASESPAGVSGDHDAEGPAGAVSV